MGKLVLLRATPPPAEPKPLVGLQLTFETEFRVLGFVIETAALSLSGVPRTPDFLVANEDSVKLRRAATIS